MNRVSKKSASPQREKKHLLHGEENLPSRNGSWKQHNIGFQMGRAGKRFDLGEKARDSLHFQHSDKYDITV